MFRETGVVLKETWRRYWPSPAVWGLPLVFAIGGVPVILLLAAMFMRSRMFGVLLMLFGLGAYGAMAASGMTGAWAAAARGGKATAKDVSRGMSSFFFSTGSLPRPWVWRIPRPSWGSAAGSRSSAGASAWS